MSHKKFGPDRFSRFDVYWIQTDRQTNKQTRRQAKFIYRCNVSNKCVFFSSTWEECAILCKYNQVGLKIKIKDYLINSVEKYFK